MKRVSSIAAAGWVAIAAAVMAADLGDRPVRIAVVVSTRNTLTAVSPSEVQRIFLREKLRWEDGLEITVFQPPSDRPLFAAFAQAVIRKTPREIAEHWLNIKLTRGIDPPKICGSATLLKRYLERTAGGIGYLAEEDVDASVKVVAVFETN